MKILTDIVHPADVNFYKGAIEELRKEHEIKPKSCKKRATFIYL